MTFRYPLFQFLIILLAFQQILFSDQSRLETHPSPAPITPNESHPEGLAWLAYRPAQIAYQLELKKTFEGIYCPADRPVLTSALSEIQTALSTIGGYELAQKIKPQTGSLLVGTHADLSSYLPSELSKKVAALHRDGYSIVSLTKANDRRTVITAPTDQGVLYGAFHLIRLLQTGQPITELNITEEPAIDLRMLNHWDHLYGRIERGYAGRSLWKWDELPDQLSPKYEAYARFCASIGINATVLNNVNAHPNSLRTDYLEKTAAIASVFRKWGIKVYLSAYFSAPMKPSETPDAVKESGGIGNLDTADPMDPQVQQWWRNKVDEIYTLIPDFGGFLVKAGSEGMPGPRDFGRNEADGANMMADVLAPRGGHLIWRAFVYSLAEDRARDAYDIFKPLNGQFRDNVFLQVKNGPLDFQPREPVSPLFGDMADTNLALELQITKEYLGWSTTLCYLGPSWQEILQTDTYAKGSGSTVARITDGSLHQHAISMIAGVANTGDGKYWCGSVFNQANWYAFGRLAWEPDLTAETIAKEWIQLTIPADADTQSSILSIMMRSYQPVVDYQTPLGLVFLCTTKHYEPHPERRHYYHKASADGIGWDRTSKGTGYVDQYQPTLRPPLNNPETTPLDFLLFYHRMAWDDRLSTGRTVWEELQYRYNRGVSEVDAMISTWQSLEREVSQELFRHVLSKLEKEKAFAERWRDACLGYFKQFAEAP